MKSMRLYGIHDLRLIEETIPAAQAGEVLLKVASVGICGSDVHWYSEGGIGSDTLSRPLVLGHEFSAYIMEGPHAGQLVAVDPALACGKCEFCLEGKPNVCPNVRFAGHGKIDGGLREHIAWPSEALFPLPKSISPAEGALLEPMGVAVHATRLVPTEPGMTVGVYGCGPIGLLTIQMARLSGASRIFATDKISSRLEMAREMGATDILLADGSEGQTILKETHNRGVDVAYEAAGAHPAVETAMVTAKPGGKVVIIGITSDDRTEFPASPARRKGLTLYICRRMANVYPTAIRLVSTGQVDLKPLISNRYSLANSDKAFQEAEARTGLKIVVDIAG
jgi:L-iditol 2-dehydrogenase